MYLEVIDKNNNIIDINDYISHETQVFEEEQDSLARSVIDDELDYDNSLFEEEVF